MYCYTTLWNVCDQKWPCCRAEWSKVPCKLSHPNIQWRLHNLLTDKKKCTVVTPKTQRITIHRLYASLLQQPREETSWQNVHKVNETQRITIHRLYASLLQQPREETSWQNVHKVNDQTVTLWHQSASHKWLIKHKFDTCRSQNQGYQKLLRQHDALTTVTACHVLDLKRVHLSAGQCCQRQSTSLLITSLDVDWF